MKNKGDFKKEFLQLQPQLRRFTEVVENRFTDIFKDESIELGFPLQVRLKTWESIEDKLFLSKRFTVKKTILEMQDIIGIRIILLSLSDINKIELLIEEAFHVNKVYNTADKLNHDQFGYTSIHYLLKLQPYMKEIPGYKSLGDFQFEVQVRTLSQHIWAETSRVFSYKTQESIPKPLLRSVGRISALLETVDFEIERLIEQREEYIGQIQIDDSDETDLNVDIIEKLLNIHLGSNRFRSNTHYNLILDDLIDNDISQSSALVNLLKNNSKVLDEMEAEYLKSDLPNDIIDEFNKQGFVMDYLGAIRFILRKEIQGYEPFKS